MVISVLDFCFSRSKKKKKKKFLQVISESSFCSYTSSHWKVFCTKCVLFARSPCWTLIYTCRIGYLLSRLIVSDSLNKRQE